MTRLLDEAGVPLLLVGDSLGMVVLGYPDTTHVTMAEMEHHVRAAARAKPRALLAADLPYHSYDTVASAVANAKRLVAAGAEAVKAEGGAEILEQVRGDRSERNSFPGPSRHVAPACARGRRLPRQRQERARAPAAAGGRARRWSQAGAFAVVLELVTPRVAKEADPAHPHPDHRHRRRPGLRRANPGHARFAGHAALV